MKCAVPSCAGLCRSKNPLGVGDRCAAPVSFDPARDDLPSISHPEYEAETQWDRDQIGHMKGLDE